MDYELDTFNTCTCECTDISQCSCDGDPNGGDGYDD